MRLVCCSGTGGFNEDSAICRYCDFDAYTSSPSVLDRAPLWALAQVNPTRTSEFPVPETRPVWPRHLSPMPIYLEPFIEAEPPDPIESD